ncbi:MAG TPA: dUTP diphosphatase [Candidatus Aenigmarchaeota archaeon]|nr:dUTP diphosphatase [Candidatus Aenigmarchaeota archaeon]
MKVKIKKGGKLERVYESVGYDVFSAEDCVLKAGETKAIRTNLFLEIPKGIFAKVEGRSGLALKGIFPIGGIIDPDYRGEVKVILRNSSKKDFVIKKGDKIAQLVFYPYVLPEIEEVEELSETKRGTQGFGSSG